MCPKAMVNVPFLFQDSRDNPKNLNDAVRFANKVYAVFETAKDPNIDILVWMDADTFVHSHYVHRI